MAIDFNGPISLLRLIRFIPNIQRNSEKDISWDNANRLSKMNELRSQIFKYGEKFMARKKKKHGQ